MGLDTMEVEAVFCSGGVPWLKGFILGTLILSSVSVSSV